MRRAGAVTRRSVVHSRSFSETTTTADAATTKRTQPYQRGPLFPWRHEEGLIPRLTPGTPEFRADRSTAMGAMGERVLAHLFLGSSWNYQRELAEGFGYALVRGVTGIATNVYQVEPTGADDEIDLTIVASPVSEPQAAPSRTDRMFSRPLQNLYRSAHESGRHQLQVRLHSVPIRTTFYALFAIPFVSRTAVEQDPDLLKETYTHLSNMANMGRGFTEYSHFMEQRLLANDGILLTTLEAQVIVDCHERFQVLDLETGDVLQGSEDYRTISHLVRMEMDVESRPNEQFPYLPLVEKGNWVLHDIDDLVGLRPWYDPT